MEIMKSILETVTREALRIGASITIEISTSKLDGVNYSNFFIRKL